MKTINNEKDRIYEKGAKISLDHPHTAYIIKELAFLQNS